MGDQTLYIVNTFAAAICVFTSFGKGALPGTFSRIINSEIDAIISSGSALAILCKLVYPARKYSRALFKRTPGNRESSTSESLSPSSTAEALISFSFCTGTSYRVKKARNSITIALLGRPIWSSSLSVSLAQSCFVRHPFLPAFSSNCSLYGIRG